MAVSAGDCLFGKISELANSGGFARIEMKFLHELIKPQL